MFRHTICQNMMDNFTGKSLYCRPSIYVKLEPRQIFDLLNEVTGRNKTKATHLLQQLAAEPWYILCDPHAGGSADNAPLHITLRINDKGVHLNCKQNADETLYIYEITER